MSKIIELYHKSYDVEKGSAVEYIKNRLIFNKKKKSAYLKAHNEIVDFNHKESKEFIDKHAKVIHLFNNRFDEYEEDSQYFILDNEMLELFDKLGFKDYNGFLQHLAKTQAFSYIVNVFRKYSSIYQMMYELDKFEGYKHMPSFDVVNYQRSIGGVPLFRELKEILNPTTEVIEKPVDFGIKKEFVDAFVHSYDSFIEFFVDKSTTQEAFKNVFTKKTTEHNDVVYFKCENKSVAILMDCLNGEIFNDLTYTNIGKSKRLIKHRNNKPFSRYDLSNSKKNMDNNNAERAKEEARELVFRLLN